MIGILPVKYVNSWQLYEEHTDLLGEKRTPVILLSDYRSECESYIKLHVETKSLRQQLAEMTARAEEAERKYSDLIYRVATKHPNESRHETAARYISQRENGANDQCEAKQALEETK